MRLAASAEGAAASEAMGSSRAAAEANLPSVTAMVASGIIATVAVTQTPTRRRRRPEEAEREILDAARQLLTERPWSEVTVGAVMGRTTLSRKSFYVYFRDRHELITKLVAPLRARGD